LQNIRLNTLWKTLHAQVQRFFLKICRCFQSTISIAILDIEEIAQIVKDTKKVY